VAVAILLFEYRHIRSFCGRAGSRILRILDAVESRVRHDDLPEAAPDPDDEEEPEGTPLPPAFTDAHLAAQEKAYRETRGGSAAAVCAHWEEQDQREFEAEQRRLKAGR
jgi:hypothetical protein